MASRTCIYGVRFVFLIFLSTVSAGTLPEHQSPRTGSSNSSVTVSPAPTTSTKEPNVTESNKSQAPGVSTSGNSSGQTASPEVPVTDTATMGKSPTTSNPPKPDTTSPTQAASQPAFLSRMSTEEAREKSRVTLTGLDLNSYAGFITVDESFGHHLFFWLIAAHEQKETTPVMLWLDGGPGLSSMSGLLWQHGPIGVRYSNVSGRIVDAFKREEFWAKKYSVIYVDSPVGTGYSFSEQGSSSYRTSTPEVAEDLLSFLIQLLWIFPHLQEKDLYIGGHSYGGKYVISLAHEIHQRTRGRSSFLSLKGIFLGAPLFDPGTQMMSMINAMYNFGTLSFSDREMYVDVLLNALEKFRNNEQPEGLKLSSLMSTFVPLRFTHLSLENYVTGEHIDDLLIWLFMSSPKVKSALHVGNISEFTNFNVEVYDKFGNDFFVNFVNELALLLDSYKVLMVSGDYDISVHNSGLEAAILNVPWSQKELYANTSRKVWLDETDKLNGFYSEVGNLCRVVVHGAGHYAARDQPGLLEQLVFDFADHGCITS